MVQYEMYFTNEYIEEIMFDLTSILGLPYDAGQIACAMEEKDLCSKQNVIILQNDSCLLCVDCMVVDYIYPLIVRCPASLAHKVNQKMMEWDRKIRLEYDQEITSEIPDVYGNRQTLLQCILEFYHLSL